MGVRQLNKFIKENVPDGYKPVSLSQECDTFISEKEGTKPILVVDLNALLRPSIKIKKDLLFGIRNNIVQKNLADWLERLHNIAELIFFVDGIRSDDKIRKRQEDKSEKSKTLLEKIEAGWTVEEIMESKDLPDANSNLKIAEDLAKKYGSLKKAMDRECDAEMVIYANENSRVLAILSDDTDFLIYSGNWKHLSLIDMDQETLDTKEYNREALRKALGLNDKELVILSTLNGNDVITFNDTFVFHKSLIQENKNNPALRFPAIAQYIKKRQLLFSKNLTSQISYIIFESISDSYDQKIKDSLDMYDLNLNLDSTSFEDETLRYCKENEFNYAFKILKNKFVKVSLTYYDHSRPVNSYEVVICLIRKHIGIILNKKPDQSYEIFSKESKNDQNLSTFVINKIVPEFEIPPLIELWDRPQYPEPGVGTNYFVYFFNTLYYY